MIDLMPDLWPKDLVVKRVLTPVAILQSQCEKLHQKTSGQLEAEPNTYHQGENGENVAHHFEIIAPALSGYRYRLFTVEHAKDQVYPACITQPNAPTIHAMDQEKFIEEIAKLLAAPKTRSVLHSLIAQSQELQNKLAAS